MMERGWSLKHFRVVLLGTSLLVSACMPKIEEEEIVPIVTLDSHSIDAITSVDQKIYLTGTCPASTYMMRVMVNSNEYSVGQAGTAAAASGIPIGTCTNGVLSITYPVPNPSTARPITFKVKAKLNDGRSSIEWALRLVNYVPESLGVPGFAIVSVGGIGTAAGVMMHAAGGEAVGGANMLTSAQATMRSGLHGVLLE